MGKFEEVLIIVLIILLLFGAKKIPDLARSIGQAAKEVRKGFTEGNSDDASKSDAKTKDKNTSKKS